MNSKIKKCIAIIPARGGSKRLPNKNILDLGGKPLIAWSIEAALNSNFIDKVVVTTDCEKIAEISRKYGAEVPFIRPDHLSTDTASSNDVINHVLAHYENQFDSFLLLQPTSPLRNESDIQNAFNLKKKYASVVSVCEAEHSPLWCNTLPVDFSMANFIHENVKNVRSQDLPTYYRINGAIYLTDVDYFVTNNGFISSNTVAYIMPQERSIDIDTLLDFKICNILLNEINKCLQTK